MAITAEDFARFQQYARPVLTPPGFSSYEIVRRAIEFDDTFGGKICFWNCVDIQWATADTSLDEVRQAGKMIAQLGRYQGGFIARQYPPPRDIERSPEMPPFTMPSWRAAADSPQRTGGGVHDRK